MNSWEETCEEPLDESLIKGFIFPLLVQVIGGSILFCTTRFPSRIKQYIRESKFPVSELPFTALLFVVGAIIGLVHERTSLQCADHLGQSIQIWKDIHPDMMLLGFLPALLFGDALQVNFFMFENNVSQILLLAFPGMLFGTFLTAATVYFWFGTIEWPIFLCLTFGSITAATDPVAVLALLKEVDAPVRLSTLISGESMLNDGAAIVFYEVFKKGYFIERDFSDGDSSYLFLEGFKLFAKEALGGLAFGFFCGILLLECLRNLNKKFSTEDVVLQIVSTIVAAYLSFYIAQFVLHFSGVLTVVACGLTGAAFGSPYILYRKQLYKVWHVIEHIANTTLFTLSGVVWGGKISVKSFNFRISYVGLLVYLFVIVNLIRALTFLISRPVLTRIGLGSDDRELSFAAFAGLRGAVGLALALSLQAEVAEIVKEQVEIGPNSSKAILASQVSAQEEVDQVLFFVGGLALLSLLINGGSSHTVLSKLGLIGLTKVDENRVKALFKDIDQKVISKYKSLLKLPILSSSSFKFVSSQIPALKEEILNSDELEKVQNANMGAAHEISSKRNFWINFLQPFNTIQHEKEESVDRKVNELKLRDLRLTFLALVKNSYWIQVRDGFAFYKEIVDLLLESVEMSREHVSKEKPIDDWKCINVLSHELVLKLESFIFDARTLDLYNRKHFHHEMFRKKCFLAINYLAAHERATVEFEPLFADDDGIETLEYKMVLEESKNQCQKVLNWFDEHAKDKMSSEDEILAASQVVASFLLNFEGNQIQQLVDQGLVRKREVSDRLHKISKQLSRLSYNLCD
eukprot:maker-scaffold_4-snap-gene-9.64-mRNA-1 protein AED:0.33 eAED:0.33 QI:0/0/0/0.75/1/1/4/0/802